MVADTVAAIIESGLVQQTVSTVHALAAVTGVTVTEVHEAWRRHRGGDWVAPNRAPAPDSVQPVLDRTQPGEPAPVAVSTCPVCLGPIVAAGRGRPPTYCSRSCQVKAYTERRRSG